MSTIYYETNKSDATSAIVEHGRSIIEFGDLVATAFRYNPEECETNVFLYNSETRQKIGKACAPPNTIGSYIAEPEGSTIGTKEKPFFYVEFVWPQQDGRKIRKLTESFTQLAVSPDKRKFVVNGSIDKTLRATCFYVTPTKSNENLYHRVQDREYVMLHGPRAVGKSTRMLQACDDLASTYHCMNVSLHEVLRHGVTEFWESLSRSLTGKYALLGVHQVKSGPEFSSMWYPSTNPNLSSDKMFVLFINEFDSLGNADASTVSSVLETFRGLKQASEHHRLQCVVCVGVFSMVRLNTQNASPFNVGEAVAAPLLTFEQVEQMFKDYANCKNFQVDPQVIKDVYERTGGHAGLVNLCGKAIDETIRPEMEVEKLALKEWLAALRNDLEEWLTSFPTVKRLVFDLSGDDELKKKSRKALLERFIWREDPVRVKMVDEAALDFLKSVGMVRECGPGKVIISNSMMRMLAIWKILPQDRRDMNLGAIPMTEGKLDMLGLLLKSTSYFPAKDLFEAFTWSFKKAGRGPDRKVPHEYYYQSQLASIICAWLPENWQFFPDVRKDVDRKRIDFVVEYVEDPENVRFVLELEASSSDAELVEHYTRAKMYGQMIGAGHVWVVHFSAVTLEADNLPKPPEGVHVLHLVHETITAENTTWSALYCGARDSTYETPNMNWSE